MRDKSGGVYILYQKQKSQSVIFVSTLVYKRGCVCL